MSGPWTRFFNTRELFTVFLAYITNGQTLVINGD